MKPEPDPLTSEMICHLASRIAAGVLARDRPLAGVTFEPISLASYALRVAREILQQQREHDRGIEARNAQS